MVKRSEKGVRARFLMLGNLGLSTKAYNPQMMRGLAAFLEHTGYGKRTDAVVMSGLMPRMPNHYSKTNARAQRFLASDPDKVVTQDWQDVADKITDPETKEFVLFHGAKKISTPGDAVNYGRKQLAMLARVLPGDVPVHAIHTTDDKTNLDELEETKVYEYTKSEDRVKKLHGLTQRIEKSLDEIVQTQQAIAKEKVLVRRLSSVLPKEGDITTAVTAYLREQSKTIESLGDDRDEFVSYVHELKSRQDVRSVLTKLELRVAELEVTHTETTRKLRDYERQLTQAEKEKGAVQVANFTGRHGLEAGQSEIIFRPAKDEYNAPIYEMAKAAGLKGFHMHSSFEKDVAVGSEDSETPTETGVETDISGVSVALFYTINFRSKRAPQNNISRIAKYHHARVARGQKPVDIVVTSHGTNGLEGLLEPETRETIVEGETRTTPEIVSYLQLPTFFDSEKVRECWAHCIKTEHTSTYSENIWGSGALVYTLMEDGRVCPHFIDDAALKKLGELSERVEQKKASLETITAKQRPALEKEISDLEKAMKDYCTDTVKIELDTDKHIGCANKPGRPSNYDLTAAAQAFNRKTGLPDILIWNGDMTDGLLPFFDSTALDETPIPYEVDLMADKIEADKGKSDREKVLEMRKLLRQISRGREIPNLSRQEEEFRYRCGPHAIEVLEKGGLLYLVSGNHPNQSVKTRTDEATIIKNTVVPIELAHSDRVRLFKGVASSFGMGEDKIGNWRYFSMHKFKMSAGDVVTGAMRQLLGANISADLVTFGHWHVPMFGYANRTIIVSGPSMKPVDNYVTEIGATPGLRGIVNIYLPRNGSTKDGIHAKMEFVLDPTLERLIDV